MSDEENQENEGQSPVDDAGGDDVWAEAFAEQAEAEGGAAGADVDTDIDALVDEVNNDLPRAELENLEDDMNIPAGEDVNLDVILDIPVTIAMEIGRSKISIRNLLQLNQGSVVELDRLAGEPMDVLVNGTLVAHGEVVVVNEKFGIRLTDVVSPAERVKKIS
ncbi:MAG: flagellar motor switch protein FliN [Gammaproteobacteria bacterium]|nr:flagellar motor switch protein FliN [Gammaproteobacteria bacterium]